MLKPSLDKNSSNTCTCFYPLNKGINIVKEYGCNLQDTFRLFGRAITMSS